MKDRRQRYMAYRRARRKFALSVYALTFVWIILALIQWLIVSTIKQINDIFHHYYWIGIIFFCLGIILVSLFILFEDVRFLAGVNWLMAILIVEFIIIGLFVLVVQSLWSGMFTWFFICFVLIVIFVLLGSVLPHDLTPDVIILFVLAFIFFIISIFFIMLYVLMAVPYSFTVYQIFISITVLLFVMYHAQIIKGGRYAEMRLNDHLLASLILFHDFVILFMLTFYARFVLMPSAAPKNKNMDYNNGD